MSVQLALTPDGRWEYPTTALVSAATAAGFTAVGINVDRVNRDETEAYAAIGARCHEVLALVMTDDEPSTVTAAGQLAEAAAVMRAEWVLTVFTTPPASGVLQQCAKLIGEGGAGMAVEFSPLGPVSTIRDAMEVVHTARRGGRAAVLIDSWHFCFGASTWDDLATVPTDDIAYVQFTDALEPESRERLTRETLHRRAVPGEGVLELDRFAGTLLDRGWEGLVSAEVLSAELRNLTVETLVARIHDTMARFWR